MDGSSVGLKRMDEVLKDRIRKRIPWKFLTELGLQEFYIGGNCLNRNLPNDIDLFPVKFTFHMTEIRNKILEGDCSGDVTIITETLNALTVRVDGVTVQFCSYLHKSLRELVESFDFAHIKLGAKCVLDDRIWGVVETYISEDWVKAKMHESTFFTGSDFPLSSLIRSYKYMKRGDYAGKAYFMDTFATLVSIIRRGFLNYEDFKNQLDAIDLGLLPEEREELNKGVVLELFDLLRRDK